MSDVVIKAEGLGKSYQIGHQGQRERYTALRDVMASGVRRALSRTRRLLRGELDLASEEVEEFWALRDVSFEVKRGEVLGIIGRNGAGKSTLLKVLSRITEPTAGRVTLRGRVASLLEVGTGFHPELTGRENIFLNGAILGMTRAEIKRKFDEIVAFAEVEKFLDTPVKRYSSGMYVRLAFAVAAHLEPEILVVDEVLAVGDAEFQKKCLGKMQDVSRGGRTVLFVSHNMAAVTALCPRSILLADGVIVTDGDSDSVIQQYLSTSDDLLTAEFSSDPSLPSITRVSVDAGELRNGSIDVSIDFRSPWPLSPVPGIVVSAALGAAVFGSNTRMHKPTEVFPAVTNGRIKFILRDAPLHHGTYTLSFWLGDWYREYDQRRDAVSFEFFPKNDVPNRPPVTSIGYLNLSPQWEIGAVKAEKHGNAGVAAQALNVSPGLDCTSITAGE